MTGSHAGGRRIDPLPEGLPEALSRPDAYPRDESAGGGIEWIQTHVSHVFLTGRRAYKLHKAVDLGFVCFASREQRNADCLRELRLNRRLASDVYRGLAPVAVTSAGVRLGPTREDLAPPGTDGQIPEHCIVMRRLPADADALSRLEQGLLGAADMDRIAACIAEFHEAHGLGAPAPFPPEAWLERVTGPALRNFASLADARAVVPPESVAAVREATEQAARTLAPRFEARRLQGRAVDGHGDLHLQHVFIEAPDASPAVIDCIAFDEGLRRIDAAAEVAFLAMDLEYRGARGLGARFLRRYAAQRDDFDLYGVIDFFVSYRAAVRAKVAALAAIADEVAGAQREAAAGSARRHLDLARGALASHPGAPLVLVGGPVGTGKSSVASALADRLAAVVVSSDRTRKHLLGLDPTDRRHAGEGAGLYSPEQRRRVYAALLERAEPVVRSGRIAVLDATWSSRGDRDDALGLARACGVPAWFVEVECDPETVKRRVAERVRRGADPSDADPAVAERSRAAFEPLDAWPGGRRLLVRTDREDWPRFVDALPEELASHALPASDPLVDG